MDDYIDTDDQKRLKPDFGPLLHIQILTDWHAFMLIGVAASYHLQP